MSGSVDDEVVRMRFDNSAFTKGVSTTLSALSKLKSALSFNGSDKGLDNIEAKANKLDLSGANKQIDESSHHWSAWRTAGLIAFATVVHRAVNAGINVVKAFTIDPVAAGFKNYETQINAVQTILANTGLKGKKGLGQVNSALQNLNTYANQTVYNFSEMAKNIGTFTAAGVKLKPATDAIKGIANLAALSGSTSDQASTAMYQLSQAIAANKVGLQDWNSVVNAGMGGKIFQKALFNTAKLDKTLKGVKPHETFDQWTKAGNSFRQSLQKGWITGKVLTQTLSQFTGDLTDAQLKSQGYNATQIKQIQELAKTASGAATHIKTFSQLTDALKEEVATAYGAIFKTIFGDINGATKLFSGLHVVLENALTVPIYQLNTLLEKVSALGGRAKAIDAFKNVFKAFGAVLKPIKAAFSEIFPPSTAKTIADFISKFDDFTKKLKVGSDTANNIRRTFAGFFAIFDIGIQVIKGVATVIGGFLKTLTQGASGGGIFSFTAKLGDMVVAFNYALKQGDAFKDFFKNIADILAVPVQIVKDFAKSLAGMFHGFKPHDVSGVTGGLDAVNERLEKVKHVGDDLEDFFKKLDGKIKPGIQAVVNGFESLGTAIAHGLNSQAFTNILKTVQVGLLGALVLMIKKFFSKGINVDIGEGLFGKAGEALEGVTGSLKAMQTQLKAKALLDIAAALGILTVSVVALSLVNSAKLATALKAMAVGFGELLGSMAILTKISGSAGFVKIPLMAASLDLLATAILILSAAVAILAHMSWEQLKKGLTAVGLLLGEVTGAAVLISKNSGSLISAGIGITAMAVALNILALAVKLFATMNWKELAKGLAGVGGALVAIAVGIKLMPTESMLSTGAGLLLISIALQGIFKAVQSFGSLDWKTMAKGLVGLAGALVAIGLAMKLMGPGMITEAAGLAILAGSLMLIEKVMVSMAKLSWKTIAKGLGVIAISLGLLAAAMLVMDGGIVGAVAITAAAAALAILEPVIENLGKQSWGQIAKGLVALAASLVILLAAAVGAAVVSPGLLVLGAASLAIGAGLALAGVGIAALATGLSLLAATGSAGVAVLIGAISAVVEKIPEVATAFAQGLVDVLLIIGKNGPAIVKAIGTILVSTFEAITKAAPQMAVAIEALVQAALNVILKDSPKIIAAGLSLLMDLLNGIKNNIGQVVKTVGDIIVTFLNALAKQLVRIVNAGVSLLEKFLLGVANALGKIPSIALLVVATFIASLVKNQYKIIAQGVTMLNKLTGGMLGNMAHVASAGLTAVGHFISGLGGNISGLVNAGARLVNHVVSGIASIATNVYDEAVDIGSAIVNGIVDGLGDLAKTIGDKVASGVGGALNAGRKALHLGGPSKLFADEIGKPIPWGISEGIDGSSKMITNSVKKASDATLAQFTKSFGDIPNLLGSMDNLSPTITPVLDLSSVQKDAAKIPGLVGTTAPVVATTSLAQAGSISAEQVAAAAAAAEELDARQAEPPAPTLMFQQTNTSPSPLSTLEIYRHTNNLISQTRLALKIPTPTKQM